MPLLGMLGLEKLLQKEHTKEVKKKLLIAFGSTAGLCLLLLLFGGMFSFLTDAEATLPDWFIDALRADRKSLLQSDAFRSIAFISVIFTLLFFNLQ
jgi:hypothetical protein